MDSSRGATSQTAGSQARLPLPCSVSPFERVSWRGPFPPLLGWSRQQRLCTVPVTLYGYVPSICNKDSCSHLPSLFSLGLLCISLQARGAPLCQVGSPEARASPLWRRPEWTKSPAPAGPGAGKHDVGKLFYKNSSATLAGS